MKRSATAIWEGSLKTGKGSTTTDSKTLNNTPYSFVSRFEREGKPGTNPEELIAAAHADCYSMMLSNLLGEAHLKAQRIETRAEVTLDADTGTITDSHLFLKAKIPNATNEQFAKIAKTAEKICPVSKLLKANITLNYELIE